MKRNKLLSMLLVMGLTFSMLVGCGTKEEVPAKEEAATEEVVEEEAAVEEVVEEEAATEEVVEEEATEEVAIPEFSVKVVTADGEKEITQETIADLAVQNADITKMSKKGEKVNNWTGVLLSEALAAVEVTEFEGLTVEASDGYTADYTKEMADAAWIAYECDGELLGDHGPVQTVLDGESGNTWMKNLTVITVK